MTQLTSNTPYGPDFTPYDALGGDSACRALADAFYDEIAADPSMARLHPKDLTTSRQKFYEFLSGWLGGPQIYIQKHGHPRLRMRHAPFPIGLHEVEAWLACMAKALDNQGITGELRTFLDARFTHTAHFMQNR